MKYGSTLVITVRSLWNQEEILLEERVTFADTEPARRSLSNALDSIRSWIISNSAQAKRYQNLSDSDLLQLARIRGLVKDETQISLPVLYFIPSQSGKTPGHYIEAFGTSIECTCPGFVNHGSCWATDKIVADPKSHTSYEAWGKTREQFYNSRKIAYGV